MRDQSPSIDPPNAETSHTEPLKPKVWPKRALVVTKVAVSVGILWFLLIRHAPTLSQFRSVNFGWTTITIALLLVQPALAAVRWRSILTRLGEAPSYFKVLRVFYGSQFFAQVLPAGGDVARIVLHSSIGMRAAPVAFSVLADRVVGMLALFGLTLLVLSTDAVPANIRIPLAVICGGGVLIVVIYAMISPMIRKTALWKALPGGLQNLSEVIVWSVRSRIAYTRLHPLSIIIHVLSIVALYFVALAANVPNAAAAVLSAGPVMLLAQALPISIGGWGIREVAAVALMNAAGVVSSTAMLVSILFGFCVLLASLPGLAIWLLMKE